MAPGSNPKQVSSRVGSELPTGPAGARQHDCIQGDVTSCAVCSGNTLLPAPCCCSSNTWANNINAVGAQDVAASSSSAAHAAPSEAADPSADDRASIDTENRRLLSQMQSHEVRCSAWKPPQGCNLSTLLTRLSMPKPGKLA